MASWSDHPVRVVVGAHPEGRAKEVREEVLPAFGHLRIGLGTWAQGGNLEIELVDAPPVAHVFPYMSVVYGEAGATCHFLPEGVAHGTAPQPPPLPRILSDELRRYL
jgi:hypothetical protein